MQNKDNDLLIEGLKIGEDTIYTFKNLDIVPLLRVEAYAARHYEINKLGIIRTDLKAFCQTVEEYGKQGEHMKVQQLNGYFMTLLDMPMTLHPMIYLASPFIVLNDEDVNELNPEYEAKKTDLALKNSEVESFFLGLILDLEPSWKDLLPSGQRQVYLNRKQRLIEEIFQKEISGKKTTM
jgi:hypothetical protein